MPDDHTNPPNPSATSDLPLRDALDQLSCRMAEALSGVEVLRDILNAHCSFIGPELDGRLSFVASGIANAIEGADDALKLAWQRVPSPRRP